MNDEKIIEGFEMIGKRIDNLANLVTIQELRIDLLEKQNIEREIRK